MLKLLCLLLLFVASSDEESPLVFDVNVPTDVDWKSHGVVSPVRNQGRYCQCCSAFAAVTVVESIYAIKMNRGIMLSDQQLLDCDTSNNGCCTGYHDTAIRYIARNGINTRDNYPYLEKKWFCDKSKEFAPDSGVRIDGCGYVTPNNEYEMMIRVSRQPVAVAIDQRGDWVNGYNGVYDRICGNEPNQAVAIVGYGTTDEEVDFWIVKKSWGDQWGEHGYIRIRRNIYVRGPGKCGIAMYPAYPIIMNMLEAEI